MELDVKKLNARIGEIQEALISIRQYIAVSEEEFWQDRRNILSIEQLLLRSIEAAGGICLHLTVKKAGKGAESIAQCFDVLGQEKLVSKELSEALTRMARFRNILIHRYWEVDEKRVYDYAKNNLEDFEFFIGVIKKLIFEKQ